MTVDRETPDMVFQRINRRRSDLERRLGNGSAEPLQPAPAAPHVQPSDPGQQAVFQAPHVKLRDVGDPAELPGGSTHAFGAESDEFPRSATMRLILKHPALALGIGIPAAGLLVASPAARRVLAVALRVGTRPEFQQLMLLSTLAAESRRLPDAVGDHPSTDPGTSLNTTSDPTLR